MSVHVNPGGTGVGVKLRVGRTTLRPSRTLGTGPWSCWGGVVKRKLEDSTSRGGLEPRRNQRDPSGNVKYEKMEYTAETESGGRTHLCQT